MIAKRSTRQGVRYDVRLRGPDGREYSRTFRTKREAETFEAIERASRSRGAWLDPRRAETTFGDIALAWLDSNPGKRGGAWARDESAIRLHLLPTLASRPIGSVTPADVQGLVNQWVAAGLAPRTVRRQYGALRSILNHAVSVDYISRTPCRSIKLPAVEPLARPVLTADGLAVLAEAHPARYRPMVHLGAVLGLRWGEVAGLRVGRVDFLARTLTVAEQRTRGRRGAMIDGPPKSDAGYRTLSVPAPLMDVLAEHLAERGLTGADQDAHVVVGATGEPLEYSGWRRRVWLPACRTAALDGLGFHDLRRANATALVAEGVDLKTAQTRMGHSDVRLTLAIYAQATTEADRSAADALGARLMRPSQGQQRSAG